MRGPAEVTLTARFGRLLDEPLVPSALARGLTGDGLRGFNPATRRRIADHPRTTPAQVIVGTLV